MSFDDIRCHLVISDVRNDLIYILGISTKLPQSRARGKVELSNLEWYYYRKVPDHHHHKMSVYNLELFKLFNTMSIVLYNVEKELLKPNLISSRTDIVLLKIF